MSEKPELLPGLRVVGENNEATDNLRKKLLWKLDTRILPPLALLYLANFVDRSNVGNAKILGLEDDLNLSNHQYATALAVFFVFYVASELPSNLVLKRMTPKFWLPFLVFLTGIIVVGLGFVKTYAQFIVVRALLGTAEGGLYPGSLLFLSTIYTREELALRVGIFYSSASLSGAFGGLLARGFSAIPATSTMHGSWRWIFIIEGIITCAIAIGAYLLLPNSVESASFLTQSEREFARTRLEASHLSSVLSSEPERFRWSEVRRGILSLQLFFTGTVYFSICCALFSFSLFLPSIIQSLGYTANEAQLLSVPPYAVASVVGVCTAFLSDYLRVRGKLILFSLPLAVVGYALIARVSSNVTKYGLTFLMASGIYGSVPPLLVWILNNSAGHYKRATAGAMQVCMANCGGIVAAFLYPNAERPAYKKSHNIILGVLCYSWISVLLNVLHVWKINRDKEDGKYDKYIGYGDDREPSFKLVL
ncbi:major facilitator superfamily domain-containing protein [Aspergillus lucknowensis]|uniref:Major facilitator superfamily domain-containing protein n=1 Tax=Aspergillus lucknowensis TaxID=176173 RepID=A0ABR4LUR6_9EURO